MKIINKLLIIGLCSFGLSACGFFDKDNTPQPAGLVAFKPEAKLQPVWDKSTGSGTGKDYLKLALATTDTAIYTADTKGRITATDKTTGKMLWKTKTNLEISSGPAAGDGIVVAGNRDGYIIALNQLDGRILWQTRTSSEILAAPAIHNGIVVVKSIDGKVTAYQGRDGSVLWTYQQVEPNLILRGASTPELNNNSAFVGFANGNLVKLSLKKGDLDWQKPIGTPEGAFAIQRMVDIDANPLLFQNRVYVATYQGSIAALDVTSGQNIWTHDISSYTGIAADNTHVYVTDAISHIWSFDAANGEVNWRQLQLQSRNITGPAIIGNYIVVGDAEGYLHVLSKDDGHFVARIRVNKSGIIANPVVSNNNIYVLTKDGHVAAYTFG